MTDSLFPLVLEPEVLSSYLGDSRSGDADLLIVDLSQPQVYQRAHVPGAVHLPFSRLLSGQQPAAGSLPSMEQLADVFGELGLSPSTHVIAYDDEGGGWAGRFLWTLDVIGHSRYSYLNGGIHGWMGGEFPIEKTPNVRQRCAVNITLRNEPQVNKDYILSNLDNPNFVVWDARSKDEFTGVRAFAQKAGHIPGAKHFEWTAAMNNERHYRIMDTELLRSQLAELGITADKEIATHCQSHHRSGYTYLLGKVLGFPRIKAYPGSWSEWGNSDDTPVVQGETG